MPPPRCFHHRVVIVGGGVAGASCAEECVREFARLGEQQLPEGRTHGSSSAGGGTAPPRGPDAFSASPHRSLHGSSVDSREQPAAKRVRTRRAVAGATPPAPPPPPPDEEEEEEELAAPAMRSRGAPVLLISASDHIKYVQCKARITEHIEDIIVFEKSVNAFAQDINSGDCSGGDVGETWGRDEQGGLLQVVRAEVRFVDPQRHAVFDKDGQCLATFDRLCLCTGAAPLLPVPLRDAWLWDGGATRRRVMARGLDGASALEQPRHAVDNLAAVSRSFRRRILVLRDVDTAQALRETILNITDPYNMDNIDEPCADTEGGVVVIVGNGGIALELVHTLSFCNVVWIVRDSYLGNTFFDATCTPFIMPLLQRSRRSVSAVGLDVEGDGCCDAPPRKPAYGEDINDGVVNMPATGIDEGQSASQLFGSGLGPEWTRRMIRHPLQEQDDNDDDTPRDVAGKLLPEEKSGRMGGGTLKIYFNDEVVSIEDVEESESGRDHAAFVLHTRQGHRIRGAVVVAATGVAPLCGVSIVSDAAIAESSSSSSSTGAVFDAGGEFGGHLTTPLPMDPVSRNSGSSANPSSSGYSGGIAVDDAMRTSIKDVYAAGDCCSLLHWTERSPDWLPMRLWAQARDTGILAARCMVKDICDGGVGDEAAQHPAAAPPAGMGGGGPLCMAEAGLLMRPFSFELFSHVTHFFGMKVVLLGRFNAQGLGEDAEAASARCRYWAPTQRAPSTLPCGEAPSPVSLEEGSCSRVEIWVRIRECLDLVKLIVVSDLGDDESAPLAFRRQRVVGALLVGDTGLEETVEHLILDRADVSRFGPALLDPDADLEGYFD